MLKTEMNDGVTNFTGALRQGSGDGTGMVTAVLSVSLVLSLELGLSSCAPITPGLTLIAVVNREDFRCLWTAWLLAANKILSSLKAGSQSNVFLPQELLARFLTLSHFAGAFVSWDLP